MSPPRKRTRVDRACQSCIISKIRCQEVTPTGCLRCRQRVIPCSLLLPESTPTRDPNAHHGILELSNTIADLSRRLESLERALKQGTSTTLGSGWNAGAGAGLELGRMSTETRLRAVAGHATFGNSSNRYIPDLLEKFISTARDDRFPDIFKEGIVTVDQVEMGFQMYV
jgi:hypothetical protein